MEIPKFFSSKSIWSMSIVFVTILLTFLMLSHKASAANDVTEFLYFRIDTELDVVNAKGVTVRWTCGGATHGEVTEALAGATASDSDGTANGVIKIASISAEMTASGCSFKTGNGSFKASVSLDGWVTRTWTESAFPASTSLGGVAFTTRASQDYNLVVYPVKDELSSTLQLDGVTASASYPSASMASSSYSKYLDSTTWKKYIAVTGPADLTGGANGYVNKVIAVAFVDYGAASKTADFDGGTTGAVTRDVNGTALPFGLRATLNITSRSGVTESKVGATVTAGGVSCTDNGDGKYYCAIPLADTGTSVQGAANGYDTNTAIYADRIVGSDAQSLVTFALAESAAGGGVAPTPTPTPTPTPEATPTPEITPTPTPIPGLSPTPTPVSATLYRKANDPKVYVQGSDGTLTWVKTIEEFNTAGYKWSDVKVISGEAFAKLNVPSSGAVSLFRKANDPKVYVQGSDGTLTWVKTIEEFNTAGYRWGDVKMISGTDFAAMKVGGSVKVATGILYLRVRSLPGVSGKIVGKVLPGQVLQFTQASNGWYKIDSGWVSGAYAKEF